MADGHVLIVDDETDIIELLRYNLVKEGFQVAGVTSGEAALRKVRADRPALILLDLMLPGLDGLTLCEALKKDPKTRAIPVMMLTARGEEADIVRGLNLGADDYITKPFSPRVVVARVKAIMRRVPRAGPAGGGDVLTIHDLAIHHGRHEVRVNGDLVELTFTEFTILGFLASRPGWAFTRYQIVEAVHGDNCVVTDRSVDVHVVSLRRKLGLAGKYIQTVRGIGYRFRD